MKRLNTRQRVIKHFCWFSCQGSSQFASGESQSAADVPVAGKRKQDVESHGDGRLRKRWCWSQDLSETGHASQSRVSMDESRAGHDDDVGHDSDVPWTEKYHPRSADEVMGNSTAVRKLYR